MCSSSVLISAIECELGLVSDSDGSEELEVGRCSYQMMSWTLRPRYCASGVSGVYTIGGIYTYKMFVWNGPGKAISCGSSSTKIAVDADTVTSSTTNSPGGCDSAFAGHLLIGQKSAGKLEGRKEGRKRIADPRVCRRKMRCPRKEVVT